MYDEKLSAIALSYAQGVGPVTARRLLNYANSFSAVFDLSKDDLKACEVRPDVFGNIGELFRKAERELAFTHKEEIQVLRIDEDNYPRRFARCTDAPPVLYYRGNADLNAPRTVAIIGTRTPTSYGTRMCEQLVEGLQPYGIQVVSGLALGIDQCAHQASLDRGVPTIGVLASGLHRVYPKRNRTLASNMVKNGGLLSKYPCEMETRRSFFPQRNRITSALSDAVIVVESGVSGGSMITARMAIRQNKVLCAVPGRMKDTMSQGCNYLIANSEGELLQAVEVFAERMGWSRTGEKVEQTAAKQAQLFNYSEHEKVIIDLLNQTEFLHHDELLSRGNFSNGQLAATLLELEFKTVVQPLPGMRYKLN